MSSVNKVVLLGRLGKDPVVKTVGSGIKVANFSLATSEKWTDKATGEKKETTEWHNCQAWRGLADVIEKYVKKGDLIYVEGKLATRKWEKDGVTHYSTEVIVDQMVMCGGKKDGGGVPASKPDPAWDESEAPF